MPNDRPSKHAVLVGALGPGKGCPPLEELLRATTEKTGIDQAEVARHSESCSYCQTELSQWQRFETATASQTSEQLSKVTARMNENMARVFQRPKSLEVRTFWWNRFFTAPRMARASLAMAGVLLLAAISVRYQRAGQQPSLEGSNQPGQQVFRSSSLTAIFPTGDLQARPSEVRWELMPGAARYEVRLLEVDRSEVWKAETSGGHVDLPPAVQARIVPAKTLFCEITAFDSSGSKVGDTGLVRFRLLQKTGSD